MRSLAAAGSPRVILGAVAAVMALGPAALFPIPGGGTLVAQERVVVPRLEAPVRLDGRIDEAAWLRIQPLAAVAHSPTFGGTPSETTEFRIAYDDEYLYVSGFFEDSDPDGVRAASLRRDDTSFANDWLAVTIDGYRDRENSLVFGVNPAGVRTEGEFTDDGATPNFAWDSFWDAEAVRHATGWSAEIRIPFTSLPFQADEAGRAVMGITVWRNMARRSEIVTWPAIDPAVGANAFLKASATADAIFESTRPRRAVYATPYLLAGDAREPILEPGAHAFSTRSDQVLEAGLDVKYNLTSNLTLDLTVNTDFAQVEADDQEINLTRFSLFFPERRLFFQERAGIFAFSTGDSDRLFYSRRIGLVDGAPARIYGGARVVGRVGSWDVGLLNMQTEASEDGSQNVGVYRVRSRLHNPSSYAGALVTTRFGRGGGRDFSVGIDAILHLSPRQYLTTQWAQTYSDEDPAATSLFDRGLGRVRLERRGQDGLAFDLAASRAGLRFDPALGFLLRRDFTRLGDRVSWGWRAPPTSRILRQELGMRGLVFFDNEGSRLESLTVGPEWVLELKNNRVWRVSATLREERLEESFGIAQATVPAGGYRYVEGRAAHTLPAGGGFRGTMALEGGGFYDGRRVGLSFGPTWSASRHLELGGFYQANRIEFDRRGETATIQVARLRARVMLDRSLSTAVFAQYSSAADRVSLNARLRYNRREGQDLYLVYNEGLNTDLLAHTPELPRSAGRTLLLKYSHAVPVGW